MAAPTVTNLQADAVAKFSNKKLVQLTVPQGDSSSVDTTVLQKACEDSVLYFQQSGAKDYDDTNNLHRQAALIGVEGFLKQYIKASSSEVPAIFGLYDQRLSKIANARSFRQRTQARVDVDADVNGKGFWDNYRPN